MQKQIGKVGTIRRNVDGKACAFCGCHQYQLRLPPAAKPGIVKLHAYCVQCHRQQAIGNNLSDILWM